MGGFEMTDEKVRLDLSRDEAVVLFEWLARFNKEDKHEFVDQAEKRVLWDLEAMLESQLPEPIAGNYDEVLAAARARVRDAEG